MVLIDKVTGPYFLFNQVQKHIASRSARLKREAGALKSQREKIELDSSSSFCVLLYSGCKSQQSECSPDLSHNATQQSPSCGGARKEISPRNLNFTRLQLPALRCLMLTIPVWGGFPGSLPRQGQGLGGRTIQGRKKRQDRWVWRWNMSRNLSSLKQRSLILLPCVYTPRLSTTTGGVVHITSVTLLHCWCLCWQWQLDPSECTRRDIQDISHITPTWQSQEKKLPCREVAQAHL